MTYNKYASHGHGVSAGRLVGHLRRCRKEEHAAEGVNPQKEVKDRPRGVTPHTRTGYGTLAA